MRHRCLAPAGSGLALLGGDPARRWSCHGVFGLLFNYGVYYPLRNRSFLPVLHQHARRLDLPAEHACWRSSVRSRSRSTSCSTPRASRSVGVFLDSQYLVILGVTIAGGGVPVLLLRAHADRQEAAGDFAGQGHGAPGRHPGRADDRDHVRLQRGAGRHGGHPGRRRSCSSRSAWARSSR